MNRTRRRLGTFFLALCLGILGIVVPQPAAAGCSGYCDDVDPQCPDCRFSAFFGYHCFGQQCRWCAHFECRSAVPSGPDQERLASFPPAQPQSTRCSDLERVLVPREQAVRVTVVQARL